MVKPLSSNSNHSWEIFVINTCTALKYSLQHGHKHIATIVTTIWRLGFSKYKNLVRSGKESVDAGAKLELTTP